MFTLPLDVMQRARERIRPYIRHTPLAPPPALRNEFHSNLHLKLENLQVTGSFKARGVFNTLVGLGAERRERGVVAASGGNHGIALAYAAYVMQIPAVVYLPREATADRVARVERWGARVVRFGRSWDDAHAEATTYAAAEGMSYIHPFEAEPTIEGQSTLGLEILEDAPETDCVLIAIGGGGLIGGSAAALKALKPDVHILGVEPVGAASMTCSLEAKHVVALDEVRTIADTLALRGVGEHVLSLTQQFVDSIALVPDGAMIEAMRWLWLEYNQLVEPSGAAVIAALQTGAIDLSAFEHPVAVICGGNASAETVFADYEALARQKGSLG